MKNLYVGIFVVGLALGVAEARAEDGTAVSGKYRSLGFNGCGPTDCYHVAVVDTNFKFAGFSKTALRMWVVDADSSPLSDAGNFDATDLNAATTRKHGAPTSASVTWSNVRYSLQCLTPQMPTDWAQECATRSNKANEGGVGSGVAIESKSLLSCKGCVIHNLNCTLSKDGAQVATGTGGYYFGQYASSRSDAGPILQCESDTFPTIPVYPPPVR